jgi:hypothetical protein
MRELKIEDYLAEQLALIGFWCIKFPPIFFAGFPDRLVLGPKATIVFVELKATGKTPRKLQARIHARLRAFGFRVEVIDSRDLVDAFIFTL